MARPSQKATIKEKVLNASLELIVENGFHAAPMSKVAEKANVSIGSIYLYFKNKDEIITGLFESIQKHMEDSILTPYNPEDSVKTRFKTLFLGICDYYLSHRKNFLFTQQFTVSSYNRDLLDAYSSQFKEALLNIYKDGVKQDIFNHAKFESMAAISLGSIGNIIKQHYWGHIELGSQLISNLSESVWVAISEQPKTLQPS